MQGILKNYGINQQYTTSNRHKNDFYSTDPEAVKELLKYETFNHNILEPMVGTGAIADVLKNEGYTVKCMDLVDYGYPDTTVTDFFEYDEIFDGDIITNPPYRDGHKYVLHALNHCNGRIAMLLKIQFLETINRYEEVFKEHPPEAIYVFVKRVACYKGGDYEKYKDKGSAICFCWMIWNTKKQVKDTVFRWIPNHIKTPEKKETVQTKLDLDKIQKEQMQ